MTGAGVIETERLLIRRFTVDDAEAYWPLVSHPDVLRYTGEQAVQSVEAVHDLLETRPLRDYDLYGYGRMACIDKHSGRLIGFSGLKYLDDMDETDVGYRFLPEAWGKGYATESAAAVMAHQAAEFGLRRIIGLVEPANAGSVGVLKKLGLTFERRLTDPAHGALDLYAVALQPAGPE
ncbi:MAG: GNAT family N-acetyltransferase [Rhodoferax sp.]|uniref:GNAT family N-acetyltransferase n=1 Tax=Rhodoferax sp. TaxID=50421 RepID=UPI0027301D12|nr:GNAT family N-acetyltransferase [Rhodoferax sp.]MDP1528358.1 GNAT family N-acetyltransferase [Rhodoferax sp.]